MPALLFRPRLLAHPTIAIFRRSKRARWLLAAPLLAGLFAFACGGGAAESGDAPTPPLSSTPAAASPQQASDGLPGASLPGTSNVTAQPSSSFAPLLAEADELEHNGFWEDAAALRGAALSSAAAADRRAPLYADALLDQLRLLLRLERSVDAEALLGELQRLPLSSSAAAVLPLLEGRILANLGESREALATYDRYLADGGAAVAAVRLRRAALFIGMGEPAAALAEYDAILGDPQTAAAALPPALLESGLLLENQGRYLEAEERYRALADHSPWLSDDLFALHRQGAVAFARGDEQAGRRAWLQLLHDAPWHWRAAAAYDDLLARAIPIDPISEARFLYRQFRPDEASALLTELLARQPPAPDQAAALYYLAAIDEDRGDETAAITGYLAAANGDPAGPLADDALWWAAQLLEGREQLGLARVVYTRLHSASPTSEFAPAAQFRAALSSYLRDDLAEAEAAFLALAAAASEPSEAQQAWLWAGKTRARLGDSPAAASAFQAALALDPQSYFGLRAQAQLEAQPFAPLLDGARLAASELVDPLQSEAWLRRLAGPEPATTAADLAASPTWQAGLQLQRAGLEETADARFAEHLAAVADDAWLLYRSARTLSELGLIHHRLAAAAALLDLVPAAERPSAPAEILRWAYPRGWPALAASEAEPRGLDELLLYALIRQESRFNPAAGSIAGALGLTQVIPSTAAEIAAALADDGFDTALLRRPERSIRYGAFYLEKQLDNFSGAVWLALAAYNGGPGNANHWAGGDLAIDPDLFHERVRFAETRLYLRLVAENYAWYQYIYRGGAAPTLLSIAPHNTLAADLAAPQ